MNANQVSFWEVFLTFCFFMMAIALMTHWFILLRRKRRKPRVFKKTKSKRAGIKRR